MQKFQLALKIALNCIFFLFLFHSKTKTNKPKLQTHVKRKQNAAWIKFQFSFELASKLFIPSSASKKLLRLLSLKSWGLYLEDSKRKNTLCFVSKLKFCLTVLSNEKKKKKQNYEIKIKNTKLFGLSKSFSSSLC